MRDSGAAQLCLNGLKFFKAANAEGDVIQADAFLVLHSSLVLDRTREKQTSVAYHVQKAIFSSFKGLAEKCLVKTLRPLEP